MGIRYFLYAGQEGIAYKYKMVPLFKDFKFINLFLLAHGDDGMY